MTPTRREVRDHPGFPRSLRLSTVTTGASTQARASDRITAPHHPTLASHLARIFPGENHVDLLHCGWAAIAVRAERSRTDGRREGTDERTIATGQGDLDLSCLLGKIDGDRANDLLGQLRRCYFVDGTGIALSVEADADFDKVGTERCYQSSVDMNCDPALSGDRRARLSAATEDRNGYAAAEREHYCSNKSASRMNFPSRVIFAHELRGFCVRCAQNLLAPGRFLVHSKVLPCRWRAATSFGTFVGF